MPEPTVKCTFRKAEKLCSRVMIDKLFAEGKSISNHFFRLVYVKPETGNLAIKILIAIPKKNLKHAVDRNRMKRLIREAYRHNKNILANNSCFHFNLAFVFTGKKCISQSETTTAIIDLLNRFIHVNEKIT